MRVLDLPTEPGLYKRLDRLRATGAGLLVSYDEAASRFFFSVPIKALGAPWQDVGLLVEIVPNYLDDADPCGWDAGAYYLKASARTAMEDAWGIRLAQDRLTLGQEREEPSLKSAVMACLSGRIDGEPIAYEAYQEIIARSVAGNTISPNASPKRPARPGES